MIGSSLPHKNGSTHWFFPFKTFKRMNNTLKLKKSKNKLVLGAGLILATGFGANAQTTIDFESINLSTESYWDGSDGLGGFVVNDAIFPNTYNTDWSYWESGFALSNVTDNGQWGYDGLYIAQPFLGANSSENYAIGQNGSRLEFLQEQTIDSVFVSNNVYAHTIMRDGDGWIAKQFGSATNAAGDDDGTNGEDWFMLRIIGFDDDGLKTDSVDFYLADYRFSDDNDDYLIDAWEKIELSSLGNVKSVEFNLLSSDMSGVWLNTPSFFVLDNVSYSEAKPELVSVNSDFKNSFEMFPNPAKDNLTIQNAEIGEVISIYNTLGELIFSQKTATSTSQISLSEISKGAYVIKYKNSVKSLIVE